MGKRGPIPKTPNGAAATKKADRNRKRYTGAETDTEISPNPMPPRAADEKTPPPPIELGERALAFYNDVWPQLRTERLVSMLHVYQVAIWANAMAAAEVGMVKFYEETERLRAAGRADENILFITDSKGSSKVNPAVRAVSYLMNEATNHGKELGLTSTSFYRMKAAYNATVKITDDWEEFKTLQKSQE